MEEDLATIIIVTPPLKFSFLGSVGGRGVVRGREGGVVGGGRGEAKTEVSG